MPAMIEKPCYAIVASPADFEPLSEGQLRQDLEKGDEETKYECMKNIIVQMLNGEKFPSLLMTIIRFVMPVQNNKLKKLLMIFWEIVPKHSPDGKLLHEMILVCDAYRRDLIHPNEYVRGSTLRFLCRLKEPEIIEPLIPTIRNCLEHRLPYVRRNAIIAIFNIYQRFPHLIADTPELTLNFLQAEQENSCRRNAFMILLRIDQQGALDYIEQRLEQISTFNDTLQLIIVEIIHHVCRSNPEENNRFLSVIYSLLSSGSTSVRFEAAGTLVSLSPGPSSIKLAAQCYIDIGMKESDNNIKLVVLDRLAGIRERFPDQDILQDMVVDILKIMDSPDIDVAEKTVDLAMHLVTLRNLSDITQISRRTLTKSQATVEDSVAQKKRQLVITMLHRCTIKYPDMSKECALVLIDLLPQFQELSAAAVLSFVKMTMAQHPSSRQALLEKLYECFPFLEIPEVIREAVWIMAEFSHAEVELTSAFGLIRDSMGDALKPHGNETEDSGRTTIKSTAPQVTADGSYASQSAFLVGSSDNYGRNIPAVQRALTEDKPKFNLAVAIATACCKIVTRLKQIKFARVSEFTAIAMKICSTLLRWGGLPSSPNARITRDEFDRIFFCLQLLNSCNQKVVKIFNSSNREALQALMKLEIDQEQSEIDHNEFVGEEVDTAVSFGLLNGTNHQANNDLNAADDWLERAVFGKGSDETPEHFEEETVGQLNRIHQLSGLSDPIYAECIMTVTHFNIGLDILLVNRTAETLQNVTVEIATVGDLKVVERPVPFTMAPGDFSTVTAQIKVNSAENAVIHGNVVYDTSSGQSECVILSELKIDVLDYILTDKKMTQEQFRQLWVKFEWENKITVNTPCKELRRYVEQVCEATSMAILPLPDEDSVEKKAGFLSANLYGQSVFREDVLANVSIEKAVAGDGRITGHVRIRAKTQGMALSMGDKISSNQKTFSN